MKTRVISIDGVELVAPDGYTTTCNSLNEFTDCCGPGDGFFERIIPDSILGLRISAACDIHDYCFSHGANTWADFHQANSIFMKNILSIITSRSMTGLAWLRVIIASFYFKAVDEIGARIYKSIQHAKGLVMQ